MSTVHAGRYVECPFSATIEFAESALRDTGGLHVSPVTPVEAPVSYATSVVRDRSDGARIHDALLLAWRPATSNLFPHFHGVLTVRPERRGTLLRITGSYDPPFGIVGRLFDAIFGRLIAKRTLRRLLASIASDVERHWKAFQAHPTPV